ncbi:glycosyltransferase family 1 protein [Bacillus paralicheniformis]|uniref:glycosyltransferase family 1 protein n=1 Tax=Bacillus TaxID=1386 RepID=UPI00057C110E|nr:MULTISPECIES: glycosyltransferase family 1 protein [Bacillus]ARA87300.1 glycosyl transferase [Bacillus paralicheniformis]MBU8701708.1 glycosyltransferase family 1 protein [Bacillus paralicheniformis]MEB3127224.1 glycosyltransferase family 1 protein [Bacillus paralicheniformis]MED1150884.1 glycosyltransferase family 1 protein [Bacillus paralicheniformis]UAY69067.1 glycosyltransferase family 1 protein [Bacillus paralicheniformis]
MNDGSVRPERVLHIVSGMNRGGAETMIMNIYRHTDRRHIQFDFISHREETCDYDPEIITRGGRVFYVPSIGRSGPLAYIKNIRRILVEKGPYAAVHAHTDFQTGFAALAAKLAGVPVRVCHSHNTAWKPNPRFWDTWQLLAFRRLIFSSATALCACGKDAGRFLFGGKKMGENAVHLLQNGIELDRFKEANGVSKTDAKKSFGIKEDALVIGHVGRFFEQKNHAFLLGLAAHFKKSGTPFQAVFAGDGPLRRQMEEKAAALGVKDDILFLGVVEDIPALMQTFDVFAMPSLFEGLPLVLVEAQASGLPCIVSDHITEETDLGLGLLTRLSLNAGFERWAEDISRAAQAKKPAWPEIERSLAERGYNAKANLARLMDIYSISAAEGQ